VLLRKPAGLLGQRKDAGGRLRRLAHRPNIIRRSRQAAGGARGAALAALPLAGTSQGSPAFLLEVRSFVAPVFRELQRRRL
jgi:hypothetical protein